HPCFELVKKINTSGAHSAYVSEFNLNDYPIKEEDILSRGPQAFDHALCTVNIGKAMVGWASIGECEHALYECLHHTCNRNLYGNPVHSFPHVRRLLTESFLRIYAMKLYALRASDYFRSSSDADRRYLMYNAILKMKVCLQGEKIATMLLDVVGAKGMEQDTFMEMFIRDTPMMPRLEGTAHVNMILVNKFMKYYFFDHMDLPVIPKRNDIADDDYVFKQKGGKLATVRFADYHKAYEGIDLANVKLFLGQVELLRDFLSTTAPSAVQAKNLDYMIAVGELLTMSCYGQLIIENAKIYKTPDDIVEEIFAFLIRDFAQYALFLRANFENSPEQAAVITKMIIEPPMNPERFERIWETQVLAIKDDYVINE
ncbi:MAG: acyl-CoA dehydrogenase family protein, partial [Ignavibacteriales bacterium]